MNSKVMCSTVVLAILFVWGCSAASMKDAVLKDSTGEVVIHATTNTSVPSVDYIVDAVDSLKKAYEIYDNDAQRAELYAQLYSMKHPTSQWNVVVGYTALYVNATYFVECSVDSGKKDLSKKGKDDKPTSELYMIFSTE